LASAAYFGSAGLRKPQITSCVAVDISRLENAPSRTEAGRLSAALLDQFGATVKPGKLEILDIDDTFCAAHGGQQLAFWNAHHDERGFASLHIYHVASGTPVRRSCARRAPPRAARCAPSSGM
jgi:Transposase DDE domain group 1